MTDILVEGAFSFPVSLTIKEQVGKRYQLMVNEKCYNFYQGETLYAHVDNKQLAVIVAAKEQEPGAVRKRLNWLVRRIKYTLGGVPA